MKPKKLKKLEKAVAKQAVQNEMIRKIASNNETVIQFLSSLADDAAAEPSIHPEIVKAATLLKVFLRNQVAMVKKQNPTVFAK